MILSELMKVICDAQFMKAHLIGNGAFEFDPRTELEHPWHEYEVISIMSDVEADSPKSFKDFISLTLKYIGEDHNYD